MPKTLFEAQKWAFSFAKRNNLEQSGVMYLLLGQLGLDQTHFLINLRSEISDVDFDIFKKNIDKYKRGMPVQYILEKSKFYGLELFVNKETLIPRLETEELVDWILEENKSQSKAILDIGTGSGAIGLALKKNRNNFKVTLLDISKETLDIAHKNGKSLNLKVDYLLSDMFENVTEKFDILVSNPPYIPENEKNLMDQSVIDYEPKRALFASDNGLEFYKKIANDAKDYLKKDGLIYLEIGFRQEKSVTKIFKKAFPNAKIDVRKDISGKPRMVKIDTKKR